MTYAAHGAVGTNRKFQARMTKDERKMLEGMAQLRGLSASDVMRHAIRREYEETVLKAHITAKPIPATRKKR
jgi:uncharacterized protein (DUF1778 family)